MNTSSLIVAICVAIPAVIALSVCAVIFYSRRNKTRKFRRQENSSYERRSQDDYIADYPRIYHYRQPRRLREPSLVFEQSPPLYNPRPTNQIRRQQLPLFSPVHTTPGISNVHQTPITINPSIHAAMPPSYAELFLTPHTLTNR